ncbi:MAG: lysoplasmalogenase [Ilumatobacteraceae bacterium]
MRTTLLVAALVSALANWWSRLPTEHRHDELVETISKPLTTVFVIGVAATSSAPTTQVVLAMIALALCLVGDVALMSAVDNFVAGLASFLLAHVMFIVLFTRYDLNHGGLAAVAAGGAVLLSAIVGWRIVIAARRSDRTLSAPVTAYLVVILATGVVGWSTGRGWVIAGTTAFVVSDSILGWEVFVSKRRYMPLAVMTTYHVAIVSLALSL